MKTWLLISKCLLLLGVQVFAYWDDGTTTEPFAYDEDTPRQSFFRWQKTEFETSLNRWAYVNRHFDWHDLATRRFMNCVAGISIDFLPLSTAIILNVRTLITAANYLEPYINRMRDVRIWALGRAGLHTTPYRYRVWRWSRIIPKSLNPEHYHGPRGRHIPRHDIAIINSWDTIYLYKTYPHRYHYAHKAYLTSKTQRFIAGSGSTDFIYVGSGFEYMTHIKENYKIFFGRLKVENIVNCEKYLPKWWGKFVCVLNSKNTAGLQNGGGMFASWILMGLGCFEIRYNDDRVHVFTDLRYYVDLINIFGNLSYGEYYEYAYQQWGIIPGFFYDGNRNYPYIPAQYTKKNQYYLWPLGK